MLLRPGWDTLVPVFLIPWTALTPDLGVQLPLSKLLFVLLAIKYATLGRLSLSDVPNVSILLLVLLIGWLAAASTLAGDPVGANYEGGELRNGWLRVVVVTFNFLLTMLPFALILARGVPQSAWLLLKTYTLSVLILCLIGIVQYIVFRSTGRDILPLGLLQVEDSLLRSGMGTTIGGELDLRPGSLAGEPKTLGMFAASAIILVLALGWDLFHSTLVRGGAVVLAVITILLTQSTSALLALPVGIAVYLTFRVIGRPLGISSIFLIYVTCGLGLLAVFLYRVSVDINPTYDSFVFLNPNPSFGELLYQRTIARLSVEDFDWVILKAFLAEPLTGLFGRGFGLGHLAADEYIPEIWRHYMQGRIVFPKSGITFFFVNGGVAALILMMAFLARITPTVRPGRLYRPQVIALVRTGQLIAIPMVVLLLLRLYIFDVTILVLAASSLATRSFANGAWSARWGERSGRFSRRSIPMPFDSTSTRSRCRT